MNTLFETGQDGGTATTHDERGDMSRYTLHQGDSREVLKGMADASVDSIVCDPPYELGFMGKSWDSTGIANDVTLWREALRVLKPGGYLLAFSGTRTYHRMVCAIEDAGFEVRDQLAWVYGCLSEDSEVLTEDGWMPYNRAKQKNILAYDLQNDVYQWEKPSRWNEYRVESDTAYRIQSDHTDQIVSRGHRCIVERGGMLAFVPADELAGVERVPYLRGDFSALPQGRGELLFQALLREGKGLAQAALSERQGEETSRQRACGGEKPSMEGRADLLQAQREVSGSGDQVCALPGEHDEHGPQGRVCDGASPCCGVGNQQATDAAGMRASHQPRCDGQQAGKPDAVCNQCGSQAVRARASYQTTVATVTAVEYSGLIWCPTVSTGAFVARRNGKVFITGNSGFPKSHNGEWGGTALKPAWEPICMARKPLIGTVAENWAAHGTGALNIDDCRVGLERPASHGGPEKFKRWKELDGTPRAGSNNNDERTDVGRWPANLIHDGSDQVVALFPYTASGTGAVKRSSSADQSGNTGAAFGAESHPAGTPMICHGDEGSAARFFYCAKAGVEDREEGLLHLARRVLAYSNQAQAEVKRGNTEHTGDSGMNTVKMRGNHHPTVKPTDLMAYLCRLVTPKGGTVLDPFMGSGSTGKAAMREGFNFIGIELSAEYIEIARARIEFALRQGHQPSLLEAA